MARFGINLKTRDGKKRPQGWTADDVRLHLDYSETKGETIPSTRRKPMLRPFSA
jgi:hypothetical protein